MAENPLSWVQNKINRSSDAATEWFKQKTGLRDVMPKPGGSKDIQSAYQAGKQIQSRKNPYGQK